MPRIACLITEITLTVQVSGSAVAVSIRNSTAAGSVTTTFGYDDAGQLMSEDSTGYAADYDYDGNGNRTTRSVNGVTETYSYDDADKLLLVDYTNNALDKAYGYHFSGRCISITQNGVTTNLTYDKESRATGISRTGSPTASYVYNGFDARVSKAVGSTTTAYKRAGADPVSPVLSDVVGSTTTRHLPGISSRVGSTSSFNHSGIKNGILQTSSSQANTGTKRYDAFGNQLASTGTWNTPFSYGAPCGYQTDPEYGLQLLGHRHYDPSIGRFLSRDPIKDGRNWYAYCENDPIAYADPSGNMRIIRTGDSNIQIEVDVQQAGYPNAHLRKGTRRTTMFNHHMQVKQTHGGHPNPPLTESLRRLLKEPGPEGGPSPWKQAKKLMRERVVAMRSSGAMRGSGGALGGIMAVVMGLEMLPDGIRSVFMHKQNISATQAAADDPWDRKKNALSHTRLGVDDEYNFELP